MDIEVGQKYFFKTYKGRGRPFVGEVVRKMGIFTEMKNKDEIIRVQTKMIGKPYVFKPYNKVK